MDIPRKDASRKRLIRRIVLGVVVLTAVVGTSFALKRLKPAPPSVDGSVVWRDTVKRGPITLERRGLGTLVPEQTMLVPATTDGRVERILIRPGTEVRANSIIMILSSPELETSTLDAEFAVKAAEADYQNLKVTLDKTRLDMQSMLAQVEADANTAKLQADRDAALAKEGLFSEVDAKISAVKAQELTNRVKIEKERLQISTSQEEAQLGAQKVKMEQLRGQYNLKKSQLDQLKVKAGFDGMLQQLPTPVEEGQRVSAGTSLGKIAQPSKLKAELKIAETQAKDVRIGQHATVDTRNGVIEGRVSRIDPSVLNGTVTVDVSLIVGKDGLPPGARPDLSVDGTIEIERLNDVVYVSRPVFGQEDSTIRLFKLEPDGKYANAVKVALGKSSVNTIEIKDGLKVGDSVILSDMSQYDSYDRIKLN
ncbi:MAG TPA: HlyD family efflux transporter periplasmic adaptor subunit [Candidatus Acidoferrales bacterium]|nr:HlyD family efflux transporter periplasmic adaptor subunit [Candidatus Acidoferrales bacterium]